MPVKITGDKKEILERSEIVLSDPHDEIAKAQSKMKSLEKKEARLDWVLKRSNPNRMTRWWNGWKKLGVSDQNKIEFDDVLVAMEVEAKTVEFHNEVALEVQKTVEIPPVSPGTVEQIFVEFAVSSSDVTHPTAPLDILEQASEIVELSPIDTLPMGVVSIVEDVPKVVDESIVVGTSKNLTPFSVPLETSIESPIQKSVFRETVPYWPEGENELTADVYNPLGKHDTIFNQLLAHRCSFMEVACLWIFFRRLDLVRHLTNMAGVSLFRNGQFASLLWSERHLIRRPGDVKAHWRHLVISVASETIPEIASKTLNVRKVSEESYGITYGFEKDLKLIVDASSVKQLTRVSALLSHARFTLADLDEVDKSELDLRNCLLIYQVRWTLNGLGTYLDRSAIAFNWSSLMKEVSDIQDDLTDILVNGRPRKNNVSVASLRQVIKAHIQTMFDDCMLSRCDLSQALQDFLLFAQKVCQRYTPRVRNAGWLSNDQTEKQSSKQLAIEFRSHCKVISQLLHSSDTLKVANLMNFFDCGE